VNLRTYQSKIAKWVKTTFTAGGNDTKTRAFRFLEESIELGQAMGVTKCEVMQLVDYVYGRPVGEPAQEVGGTMVTLASLCQAANINLEGCAIDEMVRISSPGMMERIRNKSANKPLQSPLPGNVD
jgi:hypothetical protein